jgi:hypothetical protein
MSIDLINPPGSSDSAPDLTVPGPVNDLIVVYGGWGNVHGGRELRPGTASGTARLLQSIQDLPRTPLHGRLLLGIEGNLADTSAVNKGVTFFRDHFHPNAKLIVYGYSAGGTDAMALCRTVQQELGYYGFSSHRLLNVFAMEDRMSREVFGWVRVDLLITVDGAAGLASSFLDRTVPACVRHNLNFYQTTASRIGSHGGPNLAVDTGSTIVDNVDLTGQATHGEMNEATNARALQAIRGVLGYEAVPPLWPPGTRPG